MYRYEKMISDEKKKGNMFTEEKLKAIRIAATHGIDVLEEIYNGYRSRYAAAKDEDLHYELLDQMIFIVELAEQFDIDMCEMVTEIAAGEKIPFGG